jgi:hypothetical protein
MVAIWKGSGRLSSPNTFQKAAHQPPGGAIAQSCEERRPLRANGRQWRDPEVEVGLDEHLFLKGGHHYIQGMVRIVDPQEMGKASVQLNGDQWIDSEIKQSTGRLPVPAPTSNVTAPPRPHREQSVTYTHSGYWGRALW